MDALAEGLWGLADHHENKGEIGKAVKCLEAICQSQVSFLPIVEIKTRLRIATLLLKHTNNVDHAKSHLERSQLLLKSIPSCFELKCRAYSLLSQCYHLVGAIPPQKQILNKGLDLTASSGDGFAVKLWSCNFNSQLANALIIEGDYQNSISALDRGYECATEICYPELQMFFSTSILHVHLMQWDDVNSVERAVEKCDEVWECIHPDKRQQCLGLFFYNELLHIFYQLRICDYKNATQHVDKLDAAMKGELEQVQRVQELTAELKTINLSLSRSGLHHKERSALCQKQAQLQEQLSHVTRFSSTGKVSLEPSYFGNARRAWEDKLALAPPPIDGEWLPKSAVYALVDLMVVMFGRPKGSFKECGRRIQSGLHAIHEELLQLGITDGVTEEDLQLSAIWMAGVYLMILMQFLENKIAIALTRSEFVEAQEVSTFIYNHGHALQMLREKCGGDLVRPGITRFATNYIALKSFEAKKPRLRAMFASTEWFAWRGSDTPAGRAARETINSEGFWHDVKKVVTLLEPLVKVLRMVDSEKKPTLPHLYAAIDMMKRHVHAAIPRGGKRYLEIIQTRWEKMLMHPMHKAAYYLNPKYQYKCKLGLVQELVDAVQVVVEKLEPNSRMQSKCNQEALVQMKNWLISFPKILQGCESIFEMLRGQYAHSLGCFSEAAFHFTEAAKLTESKSMQAMCQVYAAISYICIGDAESSSQALDLIGPVYRTMDSFVGVREKTAVLLAYGLLLMKQHNLQEARIRLASGLRITHQHLGNIQLVSQYLTILGSLALALHDTGQATEILKSSLTLAKTLYDVPTQIWVLSVMTALYQELGEKGNEMSNSEYERKKSDDLQKRLADAQSSIHHIDLIDKVKVHVRKSLELDNKRATTAGSSMRFNLDIPESVGLTAPSPARSSPRLKDMDIGRRGKRRI